MGNNNFILRFLAVLVLPLIFAYLELGGNWFAYRMLERRNMWSVSGTIIFSVAYALVAGIIAIILKFDLSLLMVNYGFGFSIISMFLKLEWGKIPQLTDEAIKEYPNLKIVFVLSMIGFILSSILVLGSGEVQ